MRPLRITTFLIALSLPIVGIAVFDRPSAVLKLMENRGKPMSFSYTGYANLPAMEAMEVKLRMTGSHEGTTPETMKMKMDATVDVRAQGQWKGSATVQFAVARGQLAMRLKEISTADECDCASWERVKGLWFSMPLDMQSIGSSGTPQDAAAIFATIMRDDMDMDVTDDEVREFISSIIDSAFSMEHSRFGGGHMYSLSLKSDFLRSALWTISRFVEEHGDDSAMLMLSTVFEDIAEVESRIANAVTVHMKVDTNTADELLFARSYVSFMEEGMTIAFEGTVQRLPGTVYVEIPKDAVGPDRWQTVLSERDALDILGFFEAMSGTSGMMDLWPNWIDRINGTPPSVDTWPESFEWPEEEPAIPWDAPEWDELIPSDETEDSLPSSWDFAPDTEECDAEPGSPQYIQMMRRGACPLPHRSTYRIQGQGTPQRHR